MNKQLHRIIFNAARGQHMAVAETAPSHQSPGTRSSTSRPAVLAVCLLVLPAQAQITADPAAPGGQRPTVLLAPNGVPLVNIQTPSAAGVSRNTYGRFDVGTPGAILNNSRTNTQTQLGGWVQGNPWLAGGGARVILNEVHSGAPSRLRGPIEVAGQRAEVIVANPAGISVDGAGFINASRVTLTTGVPVFSGGDLESFRVRQGTVTVEGLGLDAGSADYAAILARSVAINAGLWARNLTVAAGAHDASPDAASITSAVGTPADKPTFALDVAALGGMYANKIWLIGTEAGLGVRSAGGLSAGGDLVVTADGRLEIGGTVQAKGSARLASTSGDVATTGTVSADLLAIDSARDIVNTGTLSATRLALHAGQDIDNRGGTLRQTGAAELQVDAGVLDNTAGTIGPRPPAASPSTGQPPATEPAPAPVSPSDPATPPATPVTPATPASDGTTLQPAVDRTPGTIAAAGTLRNSRGTIQGDGGIALGTTHLDNEGGFASVQRIAPPLRSLANRHGTLNVAGALVVDAASLDNREGRLQAGSLAIATSGDIDNTAGSIVAREGARLDVGRDIRNDAGTVQAGTTLQLTAGSAVTSRAGTLQAVGAGSSLQLQAKAIDATGGRIVNTGSGAARIAADRTLTLDDDAVVAAGGTLALAADSIRMGAGSAVSSASAMTVQADTALHNAGIVGTTSHSHAALTVQAGALDNRGGRLQSDGDLRIATTGAIDNRTGVLRSGADLALQAGGDIANQGGAIEVIAERAALTVRSGARLDNDGGHLTHNGSGASEVQARAIDNGSGAIVVAGALTLAADRIDNAVGGTLVAGAALDLQARERLVNRGLVSSGGRLGIDAAGAALDNHAGRITAAGGTHIAADRIDNTGGVLATTVGSRGALKLQTTRLENGGGTVSADGALHITLAGDALTEGLLHAGTDLDLAVQGRLTNAGTLEAGSTLRGMATALENRTGARMRADSVELQADRAIDNAGEIQGEAVALQADAITNTGAITGGDVRLQARTIANVGDPALVGATRTVSLWAGERVDNLDGATVYSAGDVRIGAAPPDDDAPAGQTGVFLNRGATVEAGRHVDIAADTLQNRRSVAIDTVQVLAEDHTLTMPDWWHNGSANPGSYAGAVNGTNFSAYEVFYLDPADIVENSSFITPDGQRVGRAVVRTHADDTLYFSAHAGRNGAYGHRERLTASDGTRVVYYQERSDGVANPDQVAGAADTAIWPAQRVITDWDTAVPVDAAYGRCSTACVMLVAPFQYTDPTTTILRDSQRVIAPDHHLSELRRDVTTTVTEDRASLGTPARILAGGDMRLDLGSRLENHHGDILAAGRLDILEATPGAVQVDNVSTTLYRRYGFDGTSTLANGNSIAYHAPEIAEVIGSTGGAMSGAQGVSITARTVRNTDLAAGTAANIVDEVRLASGNQLPQGSAVAADARQAFPATEASAPGALFRAQPANGVPYLFETRPEFASYRRWLASDYLLDALGLDPARMQKRIGDGFYEQRLINEQVARLTGRRRLDGYASDEAQFLALMDAGATYARQFGLAPGVALSADQMARLTSDIVWLQTETVTLADGNTQQVLVPRVYLAHVGPDRLRPEGALITGREIDIEADDIVNRGGTIGGADTRRATLVASADIVNQGGAVQAALLGLKAAGDIRNESLTSTQQWQQASGPAGTSQSATSASNTGRLLAGQALVVDAGRDFVDTGGQIRSGGSAAIRAGRDVVLDAQVTGAEQSDRVGNATHDRATADVRGSRIDVAGDLVVVAERDIRGEAAAIRSGGDTLLHAGNDIQLGSATETRESAMETDADNHLLERTTHQVASSVKAGGHLALQALNDIHAPGVQLDAGQNLTVIAAHDVVLEAARDSTELDQASRTSGGIVNRTETDTRQQASSTARVAGLSGDQVTVRGGRDVLLEGAQIDGEHGALVFADRALVAGAAYSTENLAESRSRTTNVLGRRGVATESTHDRVTAQGSSITSAHGDATAYGAVSAVGEGVRVAAPEGQATFGGGTVDLHAAVTSDSTSSSRKEYGIDIGAHMLGNIVPSQGAGHKLTDTAAVSATTLLRNRISGADVYVGATQGDVHIAGTDIATPGDLTFSAPHGRVFLDGQQTAAETAAHHLESDVFYQRAKGAGGVEQTTQYNRLDAGRIVYDTPGVAAQVGSKDSVEELAKQPGMAWIGALANDPALAGRVDWTRLQDTSQHWDYRQQGLTQAGAAVLTAVVMYVTYGAASGLGAAAGNAAAVGAGEGVALAGGGAFLTGTGAAMAGVVAGATTAAFSALAAQAAIAVANNPTDPGKALEQLGSSANVRGLVAAMLTGGALAGLNLVPTGAPTPGAGSQAFVNQLGQNLQAGLARAVVNTAVFGGSLEDHLKASLQSALLDTVAAQTAFAIGDMNLDGFSGSVAHAMAGCAVGAARSGGSCEAGALGAVVGEISGEQFGFDDNGNLRPGAIEMASMLGAVAAAMAGMDGDQINLASGAAGNAAANNALSHFVDKALGKLRSTLQALELRPLADSQKAISDYLDSAAARGGLNDKEIAALGALYALNEALFPTSMLDVAGPIGRAVRRAGGLIKAGAKAEDAAAVAIKEVKSGTYVPTVNAVGNMKEFLKSPGFGSELAENSTRTNRIYDGQTIFRATEDIRNIPKGSYFYLDGLHKDHLEVFDSNGKFDLAVNLDGSINVPKTSAGNGRRI
ncbi:DUF637 domain-containing protein [Xylophilus sp. GOD-11R]|uniref:two-partner secretion domain-containing protein n=1 Tax=Xylophilus sp. GOD-11R TaxID=3089814 RepID=UPI00298C3864|nr:DUF637 domain-containing protein [Xylophilus sp. GOD-11R]WPB56633.1 filamentous hemagglutinin N-terminal domain-containing protein [Xylophilus sp. GOD-11R]